MNDTPFFSSWLHRLSPMGRRTAQALVQVRACTLCQLEKCFGQWLPEDLFPKALQSANSRDRHYTRWRTFWCSLWHNLNPEASCREVVRQLQALFHLEGGPQISEEDGAYCRARARLPLTQFPKALSLTAKFADQILAALSWLKGRPIKVVDGSALTLLSDTPKNRAAYPPLQCQPNQPSFPMMRFVVFFSLLSGTVLAAAQGSLAVSELSLFSQLASQLAKGDILIGDRGFGCYPVIALLQHTLGVDFIGRTTRRIDGRRRLKRLAGNDWLVEWKKGNTASPWMTLLQWQQLPSTLTLRTVKGSLYQKGFRVRQLIVVTTLLDAQEYPAKEILYAYLRRWRLEMCLDDLKTTLHLESLRNRSPEMAQQELYMRLIAHNLVRCTMAKAATEHDVPLERVSFKGSLDALRQFTQAMAQARSNGKRKQLWAELLRILAADLVPDRPGRREPRAVKRKKSRYPRLVGPRRKFRDHLKRNVRRKVSRLRNLGLM
ncbi:MAG TPA: IS4 family transposase [Candidatus Sulfotelmatobacter sp.]|nr:IS4 family transposase [Candidatus Sulfotelmatobacter sp.]